ncbi:LmbE family N-acetylglucosaminyl deacetylase [Streptomyces sp. KhCrAH-43]|uniref:PIG-L deacetylase family protein n=1 Tax=unclassified Streptomyces TaxID=2593676 RepID=UPI0003802FA0|nr:MULTISPECIES: PIG-L family deacetylase [unclassified Streptomyces]MYS36791.1 PIG-L family deacetylase [Streptomyces sp. SID4920]MYX69262.1 PIG-L family deacetylase [Streptomyces sp. SID8373]RAJ62113.1 LmbE family N-acetylglucosaminyl deacetylase [Streptomyces sp. KhCrAH-43]
MTTVLIVVAHPDDAEIAMGMRIHEYARQGARVWVHCLTTGAPGPDGTPERKDECLAAGAILGVENYSFSNIPDTRFIENRGEINSDLVKLLDETRPDVVYTHFPDDQHLDHRVTAQEVKTVALRAANNLIYFRSPYSIGFEPTKIFVGTRELLDLKARALRCFASQQQLDMDIFRKLAEVVYRQHIHHRVVERFPSEANSAELFHTARDIEFAGWPHPDLHRSADKATKASKHGQRC